MKDRLVFQQNDAPHHYDASVRLDLDRIFTGQWIGRTGAIKWPVRPSDLSPLYFSWAIQEVKASQDC